MKRHTRHRRGVGRSVESNPEPHSVPISQTVHVYYPAACYRFPKESISDSFLGKTWALLCFIVGVWAVTAQVREEERFLRMRVGSYSDSRMITYRFMPLSGNL